MDDYQDFDQGYCSPHPVDPPEVHADEPDDGDAPIGLVGYLYASYDTLTTWLGPPDPDVCDEDKTNAEWTLLTPDGRQVSVYDFGPIGSGAAGDAPLRTARARRVVEWHVGAPDVLAAQRLFGNTLITCERRSAEPHRRHKWGAGRRPDDTCLACGQTRRWQRFARRPCRPLATTRPAGLDDVRRAAGGGAGR